MRRLSVLLVMLGVIGCAKPVVPTIATPSPPFNIAVGQSVRLDDRVTLTFDRVVSDSRCPTDVVCVSAGDVVVHLTLNDGSAGAERELHLAQADAASTTYASLVVHLIDVVPYPRSSRQIVPADYSATFQVTPP